MTLLSGEWGVSRLVKLREPGEKSRAWIPTRSTEHGASEPRPFSAVGIGFPHVLGSRQELNSTLHVKIFCRCTGAIHSYDWFLICGFLAGMDTSLRVFGKSVDIQSDSALDFLLRI